MVASLEIYNKDGSLRYDSTRFRALRWEGNINVPMTIQVVTNSNSTSIWYLNVTFHFTNIPYKGLLFFPQFRKTWTLPLAAGNQEVNGFVKTYPSNVSRAQMLQDVQRDGYLIRY